MIQLASTQDFKYILCVIFRRSHFLDVDVVVLFVFLLLLGLFEQYRRILFLVITLSADRLTRVDQLILLKIARGHFRHPSTGTKTIMKVL